MVREIPLHSTKYAGLVALVDDEDYDLVVQFHWNLVRIKRIHAPDTYYAVRYPRTHGNPSPWISLHRLIAGIDGDVDHIDGNGLNCQRVNLRSANSSLNAANRKTKRPDTSSQFRGVTWNKADQIWQAGIKVNGKSIGLGRFDDESDAALAYDVAARKHFGDFAVLNFPHIDGHQVAPRSVYGPRGTRGIPREQVIQMRELFAAGVSKSEIARRTGRSWSGVSAIVNGEIRIND